MKKIQLLILGHSSFMKRRVLPAIKKIKSLEYFICSKSSKINLNEKIVCKNYDQALLKYKPNIVYISLVNSLHFKYAKKALESGFNVIVDKPLTISLRDTKYLLKIAKKKNLLLAEATLYNYHAIFKKMINLCNGLKNITHIQSNFNIPLKYNFKRMYVNKGDCVMDMGPYAASIIRLFTNKKTKRIKVYKDYFPGDKKIIKSFFILSKLKNCTYFGNFSFDKPYISNIKLFTKKSIISSPSRIFALPPEKATSILKNDKNGIKKINIKKDDCIVNFLKKVLYAVKNKNYKSFYNNIIHDATIREKIKLY